MPQKSVKKLWHDTIIQRMKLFLLFLLLPLKMLAQDITGVWTGTLYNDTTKQYLKYELAISEYDGKLSGYSHTIFVIDNTDNVGVKSVKIKKSGDSYLIEDEKLVYNNYTDPPAKGVRMFSKLSLTENDTTMILSGPWKTNQTSHYRSITGNILLHKKKQIQQSLIVPKLEELGIAGSLSFMKEVNTRPDEYASGDIDPIRKSNSNPQKQSVADRSKVDTTNVNLKKAQKQSNSEEIAGETTTPSAKKINQPNNPVPGRPAEATLNYETVKVSSINTNEMPAQLRASSKITREDPVFDAIKESQEEMAKVHLAAADLDSRAIETVKSVNIKNDSLRLTLYDNGDVDGDTVSVLLNGNVIWPLQRLTANGNSKTIYLTPEMGDSLELIMYAENLGSIPPNTGLLVVHDGDDAYEIRFSGDLQKNAAIVLRRKKK